VLARQAGAGLPLNGAPDGDVLRQPSAQPTRVRDGERTMNQFYYDAVTKMEQLGVDDEYIQGWQCGFLKNPKREEQRLTEAYEAGYADGEEKTTENFGNWVKS